MRKISNSRVLGLTERGKGTLLFARKGRMQQWKKIVIFFVISEEAGELI